MTRRHAEIAGAGFGGLTVMPVVGETRFRDLDDEDRPRGMLQTVVASRAGDHGHIGLRFGLVVERDRAL